MSFLTRVLQELCFHGSFLQNKSDVCKISTKNNCDLQVCVKHITHNSLGVRFEWLNGCFIFSLWLLENIFRLLLQPIIHFRGFRRYPETVLMPVYGVHFQGICEHLHSNCIVVFPKGNSHWCLSICHLSPSFMSPEKFKLFLYVAQTPNPFKLSPSASSCLPHKAKLACGSF